VISRERLAEVLERFSGKRVLVVGDVYLDEYVWGRMGEISKEGPIPVIHIKERTYVPGAAGNTACGLSALGADVSLVGCIGEDANGTILRERLAANKVSTSELIYWQGRPTNTYSKISAGGFHSPRQEVLRVDTEPPPPIDEELEGEVVGRVLSALARVDAVVFVDQAASVVTPKLLGTVCPAAKSAGVMQVGDSRQRVSLFSELDLIVPNDYEAQLAAGEDTSTEEGLVRAGEKLRAEAGNRRVLITRGKRGMVVFDENGQVANLPTFALEVFDVTGAGDTVTAVTTLSLLAGATAVEAAEIANLGAGVVVAKPGTATVSREEILRAYARVSATSAPEKIKSVNELEGQVAELRGDGKKIVWTNGTFDVVHAGHIALLRAAKACGGVLVVGLNSDRSTRLNKGPTRPYMPELQRAQFLAEIEAVDYVVVFDDLTAADVIRRLKPDVYVKGKGYTVETISPEERRAVEDAGGTVTILSAGLDLCSSDVVQRVSSKNRRE